MTARILSPRKTQAERFWEKVVRIPESGCWIWVGGCSGAGYGMLMKGGGDERLSQAHRLSYEMHFGQIPSGFDLDHLCRVRCCVNPDHLEPVTRKTNINRGIVAAVNRARYAQITHCPNGHPYNEENTYVQLKGCRTCRACARERAARRRLTQ